MPELPAYACFVAGSPMFDVIVRDEQSIRMCFLYENAADAGCVHVRPVVVTWGDAPATANARDRVCDDILCIMQTYHEQLDQSGYVDTPGGLEHMGDVWRLLSDWEDALKADTIRAMPEEPSGE